MSRSRFSTQRIVWYRTMPGFFASCLDSVSTLLAVPPMWKVRMVSWVPGSPIGLGGDDAHRLSQLRQVSGAEVTPVAQNTNAALGFAGERERMRTRSSPASSIFWASSSLISVLVWTMISPVNGSRMSPAATRPSTRS